MSTTIIEQLKKLSPAERSEKINTLYEKNRTFFAAKYPEIHSYIESSTCPYRIDITEKFLNIVEASTNTVAHPEAGLDLFAAMLGDWPHDAWLDFGNFIISFPPSNTEHGRLCRLFHKKVYDDFENFDLRLASQNINLKKIETPDGEKRFSPPVAFLGIFHGMHIDHYLSRTELASILMVEPEPERFEVSCYFLDYEALFKKVKVYLVIGNSVSSAILDSFLSWTRITPSIWLRVLLGYASSFIDPVLASIRLWQIQHHEINRQFDLDLDGMKRTVVNVEKRHLPILSSQPWLTDESRIAVVGSGPSLIQDIEWLSRNKDKLIIFSAHTAVRVLRQHGIVPDFQFSIDTVLDEALLDSLQFYRDVPLINLSKVDNVLIEFFDTVFLVEESFKAHSVRFFQYLHDIAPSTGNLSVAMALFCDPAELYLLGLDFGYKDRSQHHASGSIYDTVPENINLSESEKDFLKVKGNFSTGQDIITEPFYNVARTNLEKCIRSNRRRTKIFNLSDGAEVAGAVPLKSGDVPEWKYPFRKRDIDAIAKCFAPAERGKNWEPFTTPGEELLQGILSTVLDKLKLEKFDWLNFSRALDEVLITLKERGDTDPDIGRQEIYYRFIIDMLLDFYRYIIFCENIAEAERIYQTGMEALEETLSALEWPEELDLL